MMGETASNAPTLSSRAAARALANSVLLSSSKSLEDIEASRLDVVDRKRASRLPWRGQFSPELIEYLITQLKPGAKRIFDPFCGSGTVLFESASAGLDSIGAEVNPAAWLLSSIAGYGGLLLSERNKLMVEVDLWISRSAASSGLFPEAEVADRMLKRVKGKSTDKFARIVLSVAFMLGMRNEGKFTQPLLLSGLLKVKKALNETPIHEGGSTCLLADSRSSGIHESSVDAVITSPPYINVFNYHQNYRPALELLGWAPLQAARCEIGANRKFRQNRFLTVTQYCLDMLQILAEIARVCSYDASVILVVGRVSSVLGYSFRNSVLISQLAQDSGMFTLEKRLERKFCNRYGELIYEDLLFLKPLKCQSADLELARGISARALTQALSENRKLHEALLEKAVNMVPETLPSPKYEVEMPTYF